MADGAKRYKVYGRECSRGCYWLEVSRLAFDSAMFTLLLVLALTGELPTYVRLLVVAFTVLYAAFVLNGDRLRRLR